MQNFKVQHNDFTLKSCDRRLKLLFIGEEGESKLTPKDFPDIPQYKFNFKSFAEINSRKYYPDLLLGNSPHKEFWDVETFLFFTSV